MGGGWWVHGLIPGWITLDSINQERDETTKMEAREWLCICGGKFGLHA